MSIERRGDVIVKSAGGDTAVRRVQVHAYPTGASMSGDVSRAVPVGEVIAGYGEETERVLAAVITEAQKEYSSFDLLVHPPGMYRCWGRQEAIRYLRGEREL